jgi:hypothetical protein
MPKAKPRSVKSKKAQAPAKSTAAQPGAKWVESMHAHFQQTGYYRADDLNRLLGDPRDAVGIRSDDGAVIYSLSAK